MIIAYLHNCMYFLEEGHFWFCFVTRTAKYARKPEVCPQKGGGNKLDQGARQEGTPEMDF